MTVVRVERQVSRPDDLAPHLEARTDLLTEVEVAPGRFEQADGPFRRYERTVEVTEGVDGHHIAETTDFRLAMPLWWPLFTPLMKRALRDPDRRPRPRWWWPKDVLPTDSAVLVSVLMVIAVVAGYLGVVISQTLTFAAEEFGADDAAQGRTLAAVRIGVLGSMLLIGRADRVGRRPLLIGFAVGSIVFTVAGALSGGLVSLGVTQALARGLDTGLLTLLGLTVIEEVPAGVRGMAVALMAMCNALGAGMVVWVLPVAGTSIGAWRWVYVAPAVFLPAMWWAWRRLPETRRFVAADAAEAPAAIDRRRFALVAGTAFVSALFLSPASQFQNEYLRDERGFEPGEISIFRILISTPAGLFMMGAGVLADRRGRRAVGSVGVGVGVVASLASYFATGSMLWISAAVGVWMLAGAYPATRGYQSELFPTRARARVGGWIDVISVTGSAIGLLAVGELSTRWGSLGSALTALIWGPLLAAVLLAFAFPETASAALERFNPDDPDPDRPASR